MSILDALAPYKIVAEIVVFGALAGGVTYGVHEFLEHERDIGRAEVRALWDKQTAADKDAARKQEADFATRLDEATKNGADREETIRTLVAASGNANLGLRDTLAAIRSGVPGGTVETLGKSVATLSTVFADCAGRYQAMAATADRHASDAKTLSDAWPTATPPAK
jgi:hypothetical protein